jgi:hypothetical protein
MAGLNLLAAIIIYWNIKHLGHAVTNRRPAGLDCSPDLLAHILPLGWATSSSPEGAVRLMRTRLSFPVMAIG